MHKYTQFYTHFLQSQSVQHPLYIAKAKQDSNIKKLILLKCLQSWVSESLIFSTCQTKVAFASDLYHISSVTGFKSSRPVVTEQATHTRSWESETWTEPLSHTTHRETYKWICRHEPTDPLNHHTLCPSVAQNTDRKTEIFRDSMMDSISQREWQTRGQCVTELYTPVIWHRKSGPVFFVFEIGYTAFIITLFFCFSSQNDPLCKHHKEQTSTVKWKSVCKGLLFEFPHRAAKIRQYYAP